MRGRLIVARGRPHTKAEQLLAREAFRRTLGTAGSEETDVDHFSRIIGEADGGSNLTPEETIREALERLKAVPSRHGGVPTFPAFAALDALVKERDELREALAVISDRDDSVESESDRRFVLLPHEGPRPA